MNTQDFLSIARLFGMVPDEVGGRAVLASPELTEQLDRFARGDLSLSERNSLINRFLRKPSLLAGLAMAIRKANEAEGLSSTDDTFGSPEVEAVSLAGDDEPDDEVMGHDAGSELAMVCATCSATFPIAHPPVPSRIYICRCGAQNTPGLAAGPRSWQGVALPKIREAFRPPNLLSTIFLRGPDGSVYELPRKVADAYRVDAERRRQLGHLPPLGTPAFLLDEDEVGGRHKTPAAGGGGSPADWTFHRTWEYGCYFSVPANAYVLGFHRHPHGDERAVGASQSDFA